MELDDSPMAREGSMMSTMSMERRLMANNPLVSQILISEFPSIQDCLAEFDYDKSGRLDAAQIEKMVDTYADIKRAGQKDSISLAALPQGIHQQLKVFDEDESGWIDSTELVHAAQLYSASKKTNNRLKWLVGALIIFMFVLVGTIVSLTAVVIEEAKETTTSQDGVTRVKGSDAVTGTGALSTKASIFNVVDFTPAQLHQIQYLDFVLPNDNKVGYAVASYYQDTARIDRLVTFHSASGAKIMVTARMVTVTDDRNDIHFSETPQMTETRRRRSLLEATEEASCVLCVVSQVEIPVSESKGKGANVAVIPAETLWPWETISLHNEEKDCWVVIHDYVLDVTKYAKKQENNDKKELEAEEIDEQGVFQCGADVSFMFSNNRGQGLKVLDDWIEASFPHVKFLGYASPSTEEVLGAAVSDPGAGAFNLSGIARQPHPGNGEEFKTLIYIELMGGLDSAHTYVNVENEDEIHTWCLKRPTLSAKHYCDCLNTTMEVIEETGEEVEVCSKYVLSHSAEGSNSTSKKRIHPMADTRGFLSMAGPLAEDDDGTSWVDLWDIGDMAVVPGVGRRDHSRSHFDAKDAAAKGVTVDEETSTHHGWLVKSLSLFNSLYCQRGEDLTGCRAADNRTRMVDAISLHRAAKTSNAMELSNAGLDPMTVLHLNGVESADGLDETVAVNYEDPFSMNLDGDGGGDPDDDFINPALEELLDLEKIIFQGLGVVQSEVEEYQKTLEERCPSFPSMSEWVAPGRWSNDENIGMQLRAVAILLVNDVAPKVFQLRLNGFDTHSSQVERLDRLLSDIRVGVATFLEAARVCQFYDDTLVVMFSEFGRRISENSRFGTDHGWGQYFTMFGSKLTKQVYGYDPVTKSTELEDIMPSYVGSLEQKKNRGDMEMTTDVETFNACLLDAMALPGLSRLGRCPDGMRLRKGLPDLPLFDEHGHRATSGGGGNTGGDGGDAGDGSHLTVPLSRGQQIHVSRRVGDSLRSLDHFVGSLDASEVTLEKVISEVLSDASIDYKATTQPKVYADYKERKRWGISLKNYALREEKNVYEDLLQLAYPRVDTFEHRLKRWDMERFFNMSSMPNYTTWDNTALVPSGVKVANAYLGHEGEILEAIQEKATVFYPGVNERIWKGTVQTFGTFRVDWPNRVIDEVTGKITIPQPEMVDWYYTIMRTPDFKAHISLTVEQVIDHWRCDNETSTHPEDPSLPCDPACDLSKLLTIDYESKTAFITDKTHRWVNGQPPPWRVLRSCTQNMKGGEETASKYWRWNTWRNRQLNHAIGRELHDEYFDGVTDPRAGLRARMTWFMQNLYATPLEEIDKDYTLMQQQYAKVWRNALGSYRELSFEMFNDRALRMSLDQIEEPDCGTAPVENFGREFLERFTVGLDGHNEGDVKHIAKALSNCVDNYETGAELDLTTPGLIFPDINETIYTITTEEQRAVVNRILDYKKAANEPPVAAQFLCSKLYKEFAMPPAEVKLNAANFPPQVEACGVALYKSDYSIKAALEHILKDKVNFYDSLGHKRRWPKSILYGAWTDFQLEDFTKKAWGWADQLGQPVFMPQDVSGDDIDNIWTSDTISMVRQFLGSTVRKALDYSVTGFSKDQWGTRAEAEAALVDYQFPDQPELYSVSVKLCAEDLFVENKDALGEHIINMTSLFDNNIRAHRGKWRKYKLWMTAIDVALTNVCQYVE